MSVEPNVFATRAGSVENHRPKNVDRKAASSSEFVYRCCCCSDEATVSLRLPSGRIAFLCRPCFKERPQPCVYFIRSAGLVKIGFSGRVASRLNSLACQSPTPLELWHVVKGNRDLERELHQRFAADRSHGEWFHISDAIVDYVTGAVQVSGRPQSFATVQRPESS